MGVCGTVSVRAPALSVFQAVESIGTRLHNLAILYTLADQVHAIVIDRASATTVVGSTLVCDEVAIFRRYAVLVLVTAWLAIAV